MKGSCILKTVSFFSKCRRAETKRSSNHHVTKSKKATRLTLMSPHRALHWLLVSCSSKQQTSKRNINNTSSLKKKFFFSTTGLEFCLGEGKAIFVLKRALPLENLKVYMKLLKGHQGQDWTRDKRPWPTCNSRPELAQYPLHSDVCWCARDQGI